jgi:hypothetical protein
MIKKALITAAGADQYNLAMQTLVDCNGARKSVLEMLIEEARQAGIEEIAVVIHPGDLDVYSDLIAGDRQIETPRRRACEESDSVKDFFSILFAYPAAKPTGMRSPEFSNRKP